MADDKSLTQLSSLTEKFVKEMNAVRGDITSIRSEITSYLEGSRSTASLVSANQTAKLLLLASEGRASLLTHMASSVSAIASAISAEAQEVVVRVRAELEDSEMHRDARRADALRRGIIPFAGGGGSKSVLSILARVHSLGGGIFSFLTMKDSNNVRPVCVELRQAIMDFPWMDKESKIKGSVKAWRKAFPYARVVNVSWRQDIVDADFVHIRGDARVRLHTVKMWHCGSVTDAAFVHLRGIHALNMSGCDQATITDAAFVHLRGIHTLDMCDCTQATITDAAFVHLRGIHTLDMNFCNQPTITDAAFVHLRGIHELDMCGCTQASITDAAFVNLRGIHELQMCGCDQATITDVAFVHLRGIHKLYMSYCDQPTITGAAFVHLRGIEILETDECSRNVRIAAAQVMGRHYESEEEDE